MRIYKRNIKSWCRFEKKKRRSNADSCCSNCLQFLGIGFQLFFHAWSPTTTKDYVQKNYVRTQIYQIFCKLVLYRYWDESKADVNRIVEIWWKNDSVAPKISVARSNNSRY
jgi:hypothetical protein